MNTSDDEITQLKDYTRKKLDILATKNEKLLGIADILTEVTLTDEQPKSDTLSDENAAKMIKYSANEAIGEVFTDRQILAIQNAIREVVAAGVDADKETLGVIDKLTHFLHPLLSQDNRTELAAYDLVESLEWYMSEPDLHTRQKNAQKLLHDWGLDQVRLSAKVTNG